MVGWGKTGRRGRVGHHTASFLNNCKGFIIVEKWASRVYTLRPLFCGSSEIMAKTFSSFKKELHLMLGCDSVYTIIVHCTSKRYSFDESLSLSVPSLLDKGSEMMHQKYNG